MLKRIAITLEDGRETAVYRHPELDVNGNPRYFIHFMELGLDDYVSTKETRKAGLKKYKGRLFGGGYIFSSYNPSESVKRIMQILNS